MDLSSAAEHVRKGLDLLADELREVGLVEAACRCENMAKMLSRALYDSMVETQPMEVKKND